MIAGYQKQQGAAGNIEVRETVRIANNKYIQLVRIGESYFAIAVCKDTVTALGQIPAEQLKGKTTLESTSGFRELLERAAKKENEEKCMCFLNEIERANLLERRRSMSKTRK